jgi:peptidyl-prolyl cis-trans isomerase C
MVVQQVRSKFVNGIDAAVPSTIKRLLREPLVHFIVLGAVLLVGYAYLKPDDEVEAPHEIQLTLDELAQLQILFESQWRRQPTHEEFSRMVETKVRQEVLYREAVAMGLDKNDEIVKRRMVQKMQFLAEDVAAAREPTTEELRSWFADHTDTFAMPPRLGFRHVYFSPDQRGNAARDDAAKALIEIAGQPENSSLVASLGDSFMFQDFYADRTPQAIAGDFGPEFAQAVESLTPGSWQGPIQSGYGWHLVYVDTWIPGRVPAFEEVAQDVKTAWLGTQKAEAWQKAYDEMRAKYTVLLPVPPDHAAAVSDLDRPVDPVLSDK